MGRMYGDVASSIMPLDGGPCLVGSLLLPVEGLRRPVGLPLCRSVGRRVGLSVGQSIGWSQMRDRLCRGGLYLRCAYIHKSQACEAGCTEGRPRPRLDVGVGLDVSVGVDVIATATATTATASVCRGGVEFGMTCSGGGVVG